MPGWAGSFASRCWFIAARSAFADIERQPLGALRFLIKPEVALAVKPAEEPALCAVSPRRPCRQHTTTERRPVPGTGIVDVRGDQDVLATANAVAVGPVVYPSGL
jgi:hypothetical protein